MIHYGREGSWRIYFNDNVNPNDNELSTECVLQVIESPCRREPTVAGHQREKQIRQKSKKYIITTEWEFAVRAASAMRNVCLALSGYKTASLKTP